MADRRHLELVEGPRELPHLRARGKPRLIVSHGEPVSRPLREPDFAAALRRIRALIERFKEEAR
jgi:hypothetical protein